MLLKVTAGPSIVKREEAIPVQLTGSLMPVPDVVMVVPDERDTVVVSDAGFPLASSSVRLSLCAPLFSPAFSYAAPIVKHGMSLHPQLGRSALKTDESSLTDTWLSPL